MRSHAFKVPDFSTSHGKVLVYGATSHRKKLPVTLKMTVPLLALKESQSLFLVSSFCPGVWSSTFPHTRALLTVMGISSLQYFFTPYSNSLPPVRY